MEKKDNNSNKREEKRRAHFLENKSIRCFFREMGCSRDTVKEGDCLGGPSSLHAHSGADSAGTPAFKTQIGSLLTENERLPGMVQFSDYFR